MKLVVGLGNPGPEYDRTRHNVGFMVLDLLAERLGLSFARLERQGPDGSKRFSGKVKAQVCEGRRKGRTFLLAKPQTYVNLTGDVAAPLLRHSKRSPDALFVIVDDLNLPLGRMRLRPSGSAGGHNGLKSVQQLLTTDAYPRLRLGIGPPASDDPAGGSEGRSKRERRGGPGGGDSTARAMPSRRRHVLWMPDRAARVLHFRNMHPSCSTSAGSSIDTLGR